MMTILLETSGRNVAYVPLFLLLPLAGMLYRRTGWARWRAAQKRMKAERKRPR